MMSHKQLLPLLVLLGVLPTVGLAQSPTPLNFGNNFFVTGDYIVAGAYGMNTTFKPLPNGVTYAVGTINVPDTNPGIQPGFQGVNKVPPGGQVVAALLYWQTVEKVAAPGSGKNGYFGPLSGGPAAPGYAISGTDLTTTSPVAWSSGGCSGSSQGGKVVRTYRADVAGALPVDANGNAFANTSFQVWLPSVGAQAPLTLGATLVVIYRIPSGANGPDVPLNSIVIYDGVYGQTNAQTVMTQQLQGFYDADNAVSRLTHIVGSGQSNKLETVYLGSGANSSPLQSLYPNQPAFPGWYGSWDNPTWTFPSANLPNPITEDSSSATTQVVPASSNSGCVSWGAVILSTTVKNSDGDGILDSWKRDQGYCDAAYNNGACSAGDLTDPRWVDLHGATAGNKDIFLQYDYMCSTVKGPPSPGNTKDINSCKTGGSDYSFDPRLAVDPADGKTAVQKVVDAFTNHLSSGKPFVLHAIPGNAISETYAYDTDGISVVTATCNDSDLTCPFPNEPGTIGFREGLSYIKNQTIDPQTGLIGCDPAKHQPCVAVFPHGKKDSYHYALFSHGVGLPSWFLSDGSLSKVTQSGNTVKFTTSSPHGLTQILSQPTGATANDKLCRSGRVTVIFAISNINLNGTYCATIVSPTEFTITVSASTTALPEYTSKTDPNLAVANGQVTSMSGFSDVGGQNSVISLGYGGWGPPNNPASDGNRWQTKAGTFMHELGHTLGLTHGGTFYNNLSSNDYTPTFETNCKPNVQTSMSYLFQVDLLEKPGPPNSLGQPVMVVDYSEQPLPTLTEGSAPAGLGSPDYAKTGWYQRTSFAGGTPVGAHCNGTPIAPNEQPYSYVSDFVNNFFWSSDTGLDINFNGRSTDVMHGHDEWDGTPAEGEVGPSPGVDLQQISAVGTITTIGLGGEAGALRPAGGGGALRPAGGGGALHPAGGGGALRPAGGGGALRPAGGGGLNSDITHDTANSYARPPRNLSITQEEASPRLIDLSWLVPTFGQPVQYNIYRSADGGQTFTSIGSVPGTQTTFQDTVNCNLNGYSYKVTSKINNDAGNSLESVASNTVPASGQKPLTGCYVVPDLSSPASAANNSSVPITWTLTDDFYIMPGDVWANAASNPVTRPAANTLVAIGPLPKSCKTQGPITLLLNGNVQNSAGTFTNNGNQYTFTWNTKGFCSGSYTFKLDLDSGKQTQTTTTPLVLK